MKRFAAIHRRFFILAFFCLLAGPAQAESSGRFFSKLQDIPLMPGLTEIEEESYVFDKPEGRIGESLAYGKGVSKKDIKAYYLRNLPQFGWLRRSDSSFIRGRETLELAITEDENIKIVSFLVKPR